jgi:hypothetical protein
MKQRKVRAMNVCLIVFQLMTSSILRLYSADNRMNNEYAAVDGTRIDKGAPVLRANLLRCHFVNRMSELGIERVPQK